MNVCVWGGRREVRDRVRGMIMVNSLVAGSS